MNNDFHQAKAIFSLFDDLEAPELDQVVTLNQKVANGEAHADHDGVVNGYVNGHSDHGRLTNGSV